MSAILLVAAHRSASAAASAVAAFIDVVDSDDDDGDVDATLVFAACKVIEIGRKELNVFISTTNIFVILYHLYISM